LSSPHITTLLTTFLIYFQERYRVQPYTATHDFLDTTARTIQVDRLCLLQHDLRLYPETLFLSVQILDRYCSVRAVSLDEYELVGITALLVASKYEEVDPPFIREIPVGVDASEVIEMEQEMLIALEYRITAPTGYHFLRRFAQVSRVTKMMRHAANYYLERSLLMEDCLSLLPSEMATAAVCLAIGHPDLQEEDIDAEKMVRSMVDCVPGEPNPFPLKYIFFRQMCYCNIPRFLEVGSSMPRH